MNIYTTKIRYISKTVVFTEKRRKKTDQISLDIIDGKKPTSSTLKSQVLSLFENNIKFILRGILYGNKLKLLGFK